MWWKTITITLRVDKNYTNKKNEIIAKNTKNEKF